MCSLAEGWADTRYRRPDHPAVHRVARQRQDHTAVRDSRCPRAPQPPEPIDSRNRMFPGQSSRPSPGVAGNHHSDPPCCPPSKPTSQPSDVRTTRRRAALAAVRVRRLVSSSSGAGAVALYGARRTSGRPGSTSGGGNNTPERSSWYGIRSRRTRSKRRLVRTTASWTNVNSHWDALCASQPAGSRIGGPNSPSDHSGVSGTVARQADTAAATIAKNRRAGSCRRRHTDGTHCTPLCHDVEILLRRGGTTPPAISDPSMIG